MRIPQLLCFLIISCNLFAQSSRCEVEQYIGIDSTNRKISKVITYTSTGLVASESWINWRETLSTGWGDGTFTYIYSDTLLQCSILVPKVGDSSKTIFEYNSAKQLIRESKYELKPIANTGPIRPGDGAKNSLGKRWEQTSEANIAYDDKGRKISYDATRLHTDRYDMYKWTYDDQNRITSQSAYVRGKIAWKKDYQYSATGYRYIFIQYDDEGTPRSELKDTPGYAPLYFYSITLDSKGRVSVQEITDESGKLVEKDVTFYNKEGRIARTHSYDDRGALLIHKYIYYST
jgi:hypothetical protein